MKRLLLSLSLVVILPACAARGVIDLVQPPTRSAAGAEVQSVFVATNRLNAPSQPATLFQQGFGDSRNPVVRFARVDVSIPPGHAIGQIEWPGANTPDPAKHFVAVSEERFADVGPFLSDMSASSARGDTEVVLFVHGFNVNNAEAIYRLAQIAHDFDSDVPAVAFSWPSAGSPRGYAYDRDSVIFSRDALEQTLVALTDGGKRKVLIVAHSMGSQLVMETLRQMSISGKGRVLSSLSGVALISPDIDEDVFVQQALRISPFPQPFMVMVSDRDRILNISALITGKPTRLGSIRDPKALGDLPVTIIDLSGFEGGDFIGHSTAFTAPAAIAQLRTLGRGRLSDDG